MSPQLDSIHHLSIVCTSVAHNRILMGCLIKIKLFELSRNVYNTGAKILPPFLFLIELWVLIFLILFYFMPLCKLSEVATKICKHNMTFNRRNTLYHFGAAICFPDMQKVKMNAQMLYFTICFLCFYIF